MSKTLRMTLAHNKCLETARSPQMEELEVFVENILLLSARKDIKMDILDFVYRLLRSFGLEEISPNDIFIEAYLQCRHTVLQGNRIDDLPDYFRGVCFNIIKENSRKRSCEKKLVKATSKLYSLLDKAFSEILKPGASNSVFIACSVALKQFSLQGKYDPAFIFNEAYMRARKTLDEGKEITNYPAWIRATSFNIVRELSKVEKKNREHSNSLEVDSVPARKTNGWTNSELEAPEQQRMRRAFATLSPLEQAILQLKVVQGLRWADVQSALVTSGFESITPNLLSQKKRRALTKLKNTYVQDKKQVAN